MTLNRRMMVTSALLAVGAVWAAPAAKARDFFRGNLGIWNIWAPPTRPGATSADVYMVLENRGDSTDRLQSVRSPIARQVSFVDEEAGGGVTEQVAFVELRPRRPVVMRPGRIHLRLEGLSQPLARGKTFPLTLNFINAGAVELQVDIDER